MNRIQDIPADIPEEQLRIRAKCFHPSGRFEEFKEEEIEQSIPERFEKQVLKYPNRLAIKTNTCEFTYDCLNKLANRIAHAILQHHGETQEPVLLLFDHDAPAIAALFSALKAGKFYVPLDPSYPKARIIDIIADTSSSLMLTNNENLAFANELTRKDFLLINIDELDSSLSNENPKISIPPDSLAFIVYTSGSTGKPKGIVENHRNMLHFIMHFTNAAHFCMEDRMSDLNSHSFVGSTADIYPALLNGAALFPFDIKIQGLAQITSWLLNEKITVFSSVPSVFRYFVDTLAGNEIFPHLRLIRLGSDRVNLRDFDFYKKFFSGKCILRLTTGTSEARIFREIYYDKDSEITSPIMPAGYKFPGKKILILDDDGGEVGLNEVGEIVVKSRYLSPGYWRKPDLTKAKFLPDPEGGDERLYYTGDLGRMGPDGCLFHLGRKDFQVKIRGYRIEVAEIEAALLSLDNIEESVVVEWRNKADEKLLVAYIVPEIYPPPTVSCLRHLLSKKLPDFMIPSRFVILHALPLNPNGKVDRNSLPEPDSARPELENAFVPPITTVEQKLSNIWSEILGIDAVGIRDKFLELGGNSLLATRIISRVLTTFQVRLSLQSLLAAPTVSEMAVLITQNQAEKVDQEELEIMLADLEKHSDSQAKEITKLI